MLKLMQKKIFTLLCSKNSIYLNHCFRKIEVAKASRKEYVIKNYFSTKTSVVGAQMNHLTETVLLRIQNTCFILRVRRYISMSSKFLLINIDLYQVLNFISRRDQTAHIY